MKRMLNKDELAYYLGCNRRVAVKIARRTGAARRTGHTVFYDRVILDAAIDMIPCETDLLSKDAWKIWREIGQ